jgi:hypothetical protein
MKKCFLMFFFLIPALLLYSVEAADNQYLSGDEEQIYDKEPSDFWVSSGGELSGNRISGSGIGGNLSIGFGSGASIGVTVAFFTNACHDLIVEWNMFVRWYLSGIFSYSGPFFQVQGGPVINSKVVNRSFIFLWSVFSNNDDLNSPVDEGTISAGISFGWRFLFKNLFFIEPNIRAGTPYIIGIGVTAGVRF